MVTGLVLQGGGALGAFELGAIEWLLDNGKTLDVVSGVSIGAINATVLAGSKRPDPRDGLRDLWADLTTMALPPPFDAANGRAALFGNPGMYAPRVDYLNLWHWTSFYETSPLRATLAKHVDFRKLRPENFDLPVPEQAPRLILTATNLVSGKLDRFDSSEMPLTAEHVAASGSLPPSFPMTTAIAPGPGARPMPYWDGGLFDNTPLSKVIGALEDSPDPVKVMYVVNLFPSAAPIPRTLPDVVTRMMTLAFSNQDGEGPAARPPDDGDHQARRGAGPSDARAPRPRGPQGAPRLPGGEGDGAAIHIIEITNIDVTGPSDFSPDAIEDRRLRGYAAAAAAVEAD